MHKEGPLQCVGGDGERTSWWAVVGSVGDRARSPSPIDGFWTSESSPRL